MLRNQGVTAGIVAAALLLGGSPGAFADKAGTAEPGSNARGASLDEWILAYAKWLFTGEPESGRVGSVVFMPLPHEFQEASEVPLVLQGHVDATLRTGESFFVTAAVIAGERYCDGSQDPIFDESAFDAVAVTLDGEPVLEPTSDYFVPATFYDPEIVYDEPSDYCSTGITREIATDLDPIRSDPRFRALAGRMRNGSR